MVTVAIMPKKSSLSSAKGMTFFRIIETGLIGMRAIDKEKCRIAHTGKIPGHGVGIVLNDTTSQRSVAKFTPHLSVTYQMKIIFGHVGTSFFIE